MKYTDLTKEQWEQFQYSQPMTELENFLLRMIIKFYDKDPVNAEDAFSGLYNHLCVEWMESDVAFQNECAQGQDLLDQQFISDAYEEMQELDPRDYYRVDDFGDPTT